MFLGCDLIALVKPLEVGDYLDDRYGGNEGWLIGRFEDAADKRRPFFGLVSFEECAGINKVEHQLSFVSFLNDSP